MESENSSKGFLIGITSLFVVFAIVAGGYLVMSKFKNKDLTNIIEEVKSNEATEEKSSIADESKEVKNLRKSRIKVGDYFRGNS